jgi:hypothetical protein
MIKPPSMIHEFDLAWSEDPAFDPGKARAEAGPSPAFDAARELGDYAPVLLEGETPTLFRFRRLTGDTIRRLTDDVQAGRLGWMGLSQTAFRYGFRSVSGLPGFEAKFGKLHGQQILTEAGTDYLDAIAPGIVNELGTYIYQLSVRGADPK